MKTTINQPVYKIGDIVLYNSGYSITISQIINIEYDVDSPEIWYKTSSFNFKENCKNITLISRQNCYTINKNLLEVDSPEPVE